MSNHSQLVTSKRWHVEVACGCGCGSKLKQSEEIDMRDRVSYLKCTIQVTGMADASSYDDDQQDTEGSGDDECEYYNLLNVAKTASQDDIKSAYRRLCRIYHPDRHQSPQKQATASNFFRRIQEAYKALSDPRTRAVYDRSGKKGLIDDVALVERTNLPSELIEEYERLKVQFEDRTYIQQANPQGNFQMEVDATPLVDGQRYYNQPLVSIEKINMQQSVDADITQTLFGSVAGMLTTTQRAFFGGLQFSLRHLLNNRNWVKVSALASTQPSIGVDSYHNLGNQMYVTTQSMFSLTPYGMVLSANGNITRRLNERTLATLSVKEMGNTVSSQLVHNLSATVNLVGEVQVGYNSCHVKGAVEFEPNDNYWFRSGVKVGTKGVSLFYGAQHQVAKLTRLGGTVLLGSSEGVVLKLRLIRASMNFQVRFRVSHEVSVSSVLYATIVPLGLYACLQVFALSPLLKRQLQKELENKREERFKELIEMKAEAEAAIDLMQEAFQKAIDTEHAKHGLIILEAWYGKLFGLQTDGQSFETTVIDVCVPLQCMVIDSKLILHEKTKANIPGFYDPCFGEKKYLRVRYEFRGVTHEVTIDNSEPLIIPRRSHRVTVDV